MQFILILVIAILILVVLFFVNIAVKHLAVQSSMETDLKQEQQEAHEETYVFELSDSNRLSDNDLKYILPAANMAINEEYTIDSLTTGESKQSLSGIGKSWGIIDHDTAVETIENLLLYPSEYLLDMQDEGYPEFVNYLIEKKILVSAEKSVGTIIAWDLVRAINLARMCHDLEYLSEAETWRYIKAAYGRLEKELSFKSWDDIGISFLFGRFLHFGHGCGTYRHTEVMRLLLKHPDSIWKKYPWK